MSDKKRRLERVGRYSLFKFWSDGNHDHQIHHDPPSPEEARPFHVAARYDGSIPISMLVFARDAEHAKERILGSLRTIVERDYHAKLREDDEKYRCGSTYNRAKKYLADIASGEMQVQVEPFDVTLLCAEINWASNGGV